MAGMPDAGRENQRACSCLATADFPMRRRENSFSHSSIDMTGPRIDFQDQVLLTVQAPSQRGRPC